MARKILLADDSVTAQNMGRKILADAGYEVITVNNGSAALKKIGEQRPDLIVLDVYMPGYSGLEVCQRLKEVGDSARIPILLTVGKLEPFKPEEARRVRADGFIVKPFEASELLSALSKLEDKIVPRPENSKPGRFARVTAAIEEGRRDPSLPADEDSGWRSRISFPSKKKKEAAPEENADDPAIYNAVNKDLRTVVEHHPAPDSAPVATSQASSEKERVDVGALAPEGLPKDVTPEEIAAIAAAAAQIQGKVLEMKVAEPEVTPPAEPQLSDRPETSELASQEISATPAASNEPAPQTNSEVAAESSQPPETVRPVSAVAEVDSGKEDEKKDTPQPEAATMAAAAGAESGTVSHWTAVAVALAPEDAGISLEQEMQKAYAEFAAAANPQPEAVQSQTSESSAPGSAEATMAVAPEPVPENFREVAAAATEAIDAAVKEFDAVAASYATEAVAAPGLPAESETSAPISEQPVAESVARAEESKVEAPIEPRSETVAAQAFESPVVEIGEENSSQLGNEQEPESEEFSVAAQSEPVASESATSKSEHEPPTAPDEAHKDSDIAATTAAAWASWRKIRESGDSLAEPSSLDDAKDAAMAAAAGADGLPEEGKESDPDVSSIVDSVLADLRPKIVEEISRKLGKKK